MRRMRGLVPPLDKAFGMQPAAQPGPPEKQSEIGFTPVRPQVGVTIFIQHGTIDPARHRQTIAHRRGVNLHRTADTRPQKTAHRRPGHTKAGGARGDGAGLGQQTGGLTRFQPCHPATKLGKQHCLTAANATPEIGQHIGGAAGGHITKQPRQTVAEEPTALLTGTADQRPALL